MSLLCPQIEKAKNKSKRQRNNKKQDKQRNNFRNDLSSASQDVPFQNVDPHPCVKGETDAGQASAGSVGTAGCEEED